ncbi:MAG: hypothetical protein RLZZ383_1064 [Pseudomonadota bacterium]|jgi:hypothetical protein
MRRSRSFPVRFALATLLLVVSVLMGDRPARAQGIDILGVAQQKVEESVEVQQDAAKARLAALDKKNGQKKARVLVLRWPDAPVTEDNLILQAMVRNQILRPNAVFQPGLDLYQEGRRRLFVDGLPADPLDQPGRVPDAALARVRRGLEAAQTKLGTRTDDLAIAGSLLPLIDAVWFNDRQDTRELLFDLYVTTGRAVFNLRNQTPPYFRMVGPEPTNYYLFLAAAMVWEDRTYGPPLDNAELAMEKRLPSGDVRDYILDLVAQIDDGVHPTLPLAFHDQGFFDAPAFAKEYKVLLNGVERVVDGTGMLITPRGRIHLSVERDDGFSFSERVEVQRLDDKIYFVWEVARQKMGYDLLNQLMAFPNECLPDLDAATRASLATFQALHPRDEIYVAIPKAGSPYSVWVWRWDKRSGRLRLELDRNHGFPVRFSALSSVGLGFNGATVDTAALTALETTDPSTLQGGGLGSVVGVDDLSSLLKPTPASFPIDLQLRGQFNRFMFGFGVQFAKNVSAEGDGLWHERYQTDGNLVVADLPTDGSEPREVFKDLQWSRYLYGQLGVFLLQDAGMGIGPRLFVRSGVHNAPHAVEVTGHLGLTEDPSFGRKDYKGRVVPLIDVDLFGGALIPFGDTLFRGEMIDPGDPSDGYRVTVLPHFGFTAGAGFSF